MGYFVPLKEKMENRGLLFIPDISGFTRFVNETEIGHSSLIIRELLEILINANDLGLEISEIEGDAILFYKFGGIPDLEAVYKQVEKMFCQFHRHLIAYDRHRFCQCKACSSAIDLTLKVVTHYGEFAGYNVKNFSKLIGKDIIVAHQLLKNDIVQHEYWLVTDSLGQDNEPAGFAQWMKWDHSVKQTENGEIPFHYTQLSQLKDGIEPDDSLLPELAEKTAMITLTRDYATDIITLFHATGDFNYRSRWMEGVKAVEQVSHFLPRVGMKCRSILDNGQEMVYSTSYSYQEERIEFSETDEKGKTASYFILEKMDDKKTRLTLTYYLKKSILGEALFTLLKKKAMEESLRRSMMNLDTLVKEIKI
jgi:hypothetical protein